MKSELTVRSFTEPVRQRLLSAISRIAKAEALGRRVRDVPPETGAEDFSEVQHAGIPTLKAAIVAEVLMLRDLMPAAAAN